MINWLVTSTRVLSEYHGLRRELTCSFVLTNQALIQLSHLRPKNAAVLTRTLVQQSPEAKARTDEIASVIRSAAAAFAAQARSTSGTVVVSTTTVSSATTPLQGRLVSSVKKPAPVADVWSHVSAGPSDSNPRRPSSSLFGSSLSRKAFSLAPSNAQSASSSLFGNALGPRPGQNSRRSSRRASPGFAAVQSSIFSTLAGKGKVTTEVEGSGSTFPTPETVPFVPAANRKNAISDPSHISRSTAAEGRKAEVEVSEAGAPKAAADSDVVVSVKKKKTKKTKKKSSSPGDAEHPSAADGVKSEKQPAKKQKVNVEDIPAFSYDNVANLLDEPAKAATNQRKPRKTAKHAKQGDSKKRTGEFRSGFDGKQWQIADDAPGIDTSAFRRPAPDATQPKSGNRSGTFL